MPVIRPTPVPSPSTVTRTTSAVFILVRNMAFITPSTNAATLADAATVTVLAAPNRQAALIVLANNVSGRHAEAVAEGHAVATRTAAGPRPRRTNRARNIDRAR